MALTRHLIISMISLMLISGTTMVKTSNNLKNSELLDIPSLFFFGDSTVDTGNNNYIQDVLISLVKANHYPYGKDFPGHVANGRFSNGKVIPDFLASFLKLKQTLPPFLHPNLSDHDLLTGVNFAFGGAGFDDLTFSVTHVIPMSKQPHYFRTYVKKLKKIAGEEEAQKLVEKALAFISAGTNDFTFSFYGFPIRSVEFKFDISRYQDFVLKNLQSVIQELYELGLRRIAVTGLPPVGCIPLQMTLKFENPFHRKCVKKQNSDSKLYNQKLVKLLSQLEQVLPGSRLVYADIYGPTMDMLNHPTKYGFGITNRGCCGSGLVALGPLCNVLTPTCNDSSKYLFWDSVHPTEAAYGYVSQYLEQNVLPKFLDFKI